jgi:hypothetical protein
MLKDVFRELVDMAGGTNRAADKTCVNASRISNYCSPNDPSMPPADVVLDLEQSVIEAGGDPIFTRAMADVVRFTLIPQAQAEGPAIDYAKHLGDVASELSDVVNSVAKALPGGVDAREARDIHEQVNDAEEALARLKRDVAPAAAQVAPIRRVS